MNLNEKQPSFLDYQVRKTGFVGARKGNELLAGDIVTDQHGFVGIVKFMSDSKGAWIEFVDGAEGYAKDMKLVLNIISISNPAFFEFQRRYFGFSIGLARIMEETLREYFPSTNMFYNGKEVYVKGATQHAATKRYTAQKINDQQSYFSAKLTPLYNCEIEAFAVRKNIRKSRFSYNLLRELFVDIDLNKEQANRIRFVVNDENEYNEFTWNRIIRIFKKFNIRYAGAS